MVMVALLIAAGAAAAAAPNANDALVLAESELPTYWTLVETSFRAPAYPATAIRERVSGCVAVGFEVEPDGRVTHPALLRASLANASSPAGRLLSDAALASVTRARYEPTAANAARHAAYTYMTIGYSLGERASAANVEPCRIADFPTFLQRRIAEQAAAAP